MSFETPLPTYNANDPFATFVNASCLDLLFGELVPLTLNIVEDQQKEIVRNRLQALGYRVGQGLAERFSRDRPRFADNLEVIKFLCKDLWTLVFRKQIDNLKTNHRVRHLEVKGLRRLREAC